MMILCVRVCCFISSVCVVSFALWCGCVGVRVCVAQLDDGRSAAQLLSCCNGSSPD